MITNTASLLVLLKKAGLTAAKLRKFLTSTDTPLSLMEHFPALSVSEGIETMENLERKGIRVLSFLDAEYPKRLKSLSSFPLILYMQGTLIPQDENALAVIGTRAATAYGLDTAENWAAEIAAAGITIVSGLARGIDTAAHKGALKKGRTLAVLGSGFFNLYPRENQKLAEAIKENGVLISEYPPETPPFKTHFPERNRLVSGLSKGVLLIESPLKGGGMLTMEIAHTQEKKLFTIPARVDMPSFEGNFSLIKEKKASLVSSVQDIFSHFSVLAPSVFLREKPILSEEESILFDQLPYEEKSIDELVLLTQLPVMKLNVLLTRLVLKKAMKEFPGKIYKKIY